MQPDRHEKIVLEASKGSSSALDELFARHLPGLVAFVRARAGNAILKREECFDLAQSACREVLQDLAQHDYEDEQNFRHWLFLAAERKILDRARYHGRAKRAGGYAQSSVSEAEMLRAGYAWLATPSREAAGREELERAEEALQRLPEDYRQAILLARVVGLPHARIAQLLGCNEAAARGLLRRALARLSVEMGGSPD
ncbi:MAG: sigma-70 family RNA polymerase sigma factor [Planctomycetes bacterium]|nr:sigma-70 family RNA polymerase sigma factor [Planctomycetota bacterium]